MYDEKFVRTYFNPNELRDTNKRRMIVDSSMRGTVDALGLNETHKFG